MNRTPERSLVHDPKEIAAVRNLSVFPLLALAACSVESDEANDQVTLEYDQNRIEKAARTAEGVAAEVGNVAADTGRAIKNEVGDIDVDVDVKRTSANQAN